MTSIRECNKRLTLRVVSEEFADRGFAATKTSDIATRAGLPKLNVYYYFQSKENLYHCVLESIIEPLLQASVPFRVENDPLLALPAYIRSKIRIPRELPHASKVFVSEITHGAPHPLKEYLDELNAQAQCNVTCPQIWIDHGQFTPMDPYHLLFAIWAATQTYADFSWQIPTVTDKEQLSDVDYDAAAETITRLVLKGCTSDGQSGKSAGWLWSLPL